MDEDQGGVGADAGPLVALGGQAHNVKKAGAILIKAYSKENKNPDVLAAVDLGSNSFHMIVARLSHGQLTVIDRLREMVRLAAGLDRHDRLDAKSQRIALECLARVLGIRVVDVLTTEFMATCTTETCSTRTVDDNGTCVDAEGALADWDPSEDEKESELWFDDAP